MGRLWTLRSFLDKWAGAAGRAGGWSGLDESLFQAKPLKGPERDADCIAVAGRPLRGKFYWHPFCAAAELRFRLALLRADLPKYPQLLKYGFQLNLR